MISVKAKNTDLIKVKRNRYIRHALLIIFRYTKSGWDMKEFNCFEERIREL